jgi:hypothetical protein
VKRKTLLEKAADYDNRMQIPHESMTVTAERLAAYMAGYRAAKRDMQRRRQK